MGMQKLPYHTTSTGWPVPPASYVVATSRAEEAKGNGQVVYETTRSGAEDQVDRALPLARVPPADLYEVRQWTSQAEPTASVSVPSFEKAEWMLRSVTRHDLALLARDLLLVAINACRTGNLEALTHLISDWEATIEVMADKRAFKAIEKARRELKDGKGLPWNKVRRELSL